MAAKATPDNASGDSNTLNAQEIGPVSSSEKPLGTPSNRSRLNYDTAAEKTVREGTGRPGGPRKPKSLREDGRRELEEDDAWEVLGFHYPSWKKWSILGVIFIVQVSMNFNASVYANAVDPMSEYFGISQQAARVGQCVFLIAYAFGSELWAPWSEELGRKIILQSSLALVNLWQIPCALAPNFGTIVVGRFLGGISSAGGSVTLGMVADMWSADDQQFAVAFIVLSSVGGSVVGPIVGGFSQAYLDWRWVFWLQLIFGVAVQAIHLLVPETRTTIILDKEAKRRRKANPNANWWGPTELDGKSISMAELLRVWGRPFVMFFTEPIVLCLSLLSGFSDALIFTFLESYSPVFKQWNFSVVQLGLAFIPLLIGYIIAYLSFIPFIRRDNAARKRNPSGTPPERRLYWLLYTAPLETIGLLGFAWTSLGPPAVHWIAPLIFSALVGIANYAIYMATIDYMVAAYGPYSASATGGNALARDFLAGVAALYATPFYEHVGTKYKLEYPTTILACMAFLFTLPIYVFYMYGPQIRARSKFAMSLAGEHKHGEENSTEGKTETSALGQSDSRQEDDVAA
ncbi:hypothetical protein MMC25_001334 [Agyrium rufum]|nr:hypothetical protein [Agyrium rufum]